MIESIERCLKASRAVTPNKTSPQPNDPVAPATEADCLLQEETLQELQELSPGTTDTETDLAEPSEPPGAWFRPQTKPDSEPTPAEPKELPGAWLRPQKTPDSEPTPAEPRELPGKWLRPQTSTHAKTAFAEPNTENLHHNDTFNRVEKEEDMLNSKSSYGKQRQPEPISRIDRLNMVLADLKAVSGSIEACAVVSEDGLIMASNLPQEMEEDSVAAMSAVILSMGERTAVELARGSAELLFIRGQNGYVVTTRAGEHAALLITARQEAKLGLIFLDLSRAAQRVAEIIE
jgi:uncharacterized protein